MPTKVSKINFLRERGSEVDGDSSCGSDQSTTSDRQCTVRAQCWVRGSTSLVLYMCVLPACSQTFIYLFIWRIDKP